MSEHDVYFRRTVEALKGRTRVGATDSVLSRDAVTAMYVAKDLEAEGLIGPAAGGFHAVYPGAIRAWLRAADLETTLANERVVHQSALGDLRSTHEALAKVIGARDDAQRELRLARGRNTNLEERRYAAFLSALAGWGIALLLGVTLMWLVIA